MRSLIRRVGCRRPVGVLVTLAVAATALPLVGRSSLSAQAVGADTCPTAAEAPYVVPSWSDGAGWAHPDQYRTILNGDLDGNGTGELLGRNGTHIEIFTWSEKVGRAGKAYDPAPGQWEQVLPTGTPPTFRTEDGWWDPSTSSTFQLADIDGLPGEELLVRTVEGLDVYGFDTTSKTLVLRNHTGLFADDTGYALAHPEYWSTIATGDVDGVPGDEVMIRGRDGLQTYSFDGNSSAAPRHLESAPGPFSDATGWAAPEYYSTIRVADFDGDGVDEVAARGAAGVELYDLTGSTWVTAAGTLTAWSDGSGWNQPLTYDTISAADLDGDGRAELLGRDQFGLDAWTYSGGTWTRVGAPGTFTDADGLGQPEYALTLQPADVLPDPGHEVIIRGPGGVMTASLRAGTWVVDPTPIALFSDKAGWDSYTPTRGQDDWADEVDPHNPKFNPSTIPADFRYGTIRPATISTAPGATQVIIGRGGTGIHTVRADGSSPSAPFPTYTDMTVTDAEGTHLISFETGTDLAPLGDDQYKRAYWYINHWATSEVRTPGGGVRPPLWGGPAPLTDRFPDISLVDPLRKLSEEITSGAVAAGQDQAVHVPRAVFESVQQDVADWLAAVDSLYTHTYGAQGVKKLITEVFLLSQDQIDQIKAAFEENPALVTLLTDLTWAVIGALSALVGTIPGLEEATVALWAAAGSLAGGGVAAGLGFDDPNAATDALGDTLHQTLDDTAQCALAFADASYEQSVSDYGLLTSASRTIERTSTLPTQFDALVAAGIDANRLWVWQQFGNRTDGENFWLGVCTRSAFTACDWDESPTLDAVTWAAPENPDVLYRLVGKLDGSQNGNCGYTVLVDGNAGLQALFADGTVSDRDVIAPRLTDGASRGQPGWIASFGTGGEGRSGINGWDLPRWDCTGSVVDGVAP